VLPWTQVQNPKAEQTFRGDVFALKTVVDAFAPQASPAFDEIQKQFATEFDYRGECANAVEVRANLVRSGHFPNVLVPRMHAALCTRRLLVMEEIFPCVPLHHALDAQAALVARQRGVTKEEFVAAEKARIEAESREAASRGRLVRQLSHNTYERYIALQRVRAACWRGAARLYNWTIGVLTLGASRYDLAALSAEALIPINAASLVDELLSVTAHQVLIDGCFNADPHPGNILYVDSVHPPKLGLIDYGQVKRLTDQQRYDVAKVFLLVEAALRIDPKTDPQADPAAHARAKAAIARHQFEALGVKTEKLDPEVAYEQACVYFGRMDAAWLYPLNVIQWSDSVEARDPLKDISTCEYLVMLNMTTMMIRGLGEMLQQYRNLAAVWAPTARRALSEQPGLLETVEAEIRSWHEP